MGGQGTFDLTIPLPLFRTHRVLVTVRLKQPKIFSLAPHLTLSNVRVGWHFLLCSRFLFQPKLLITKAAEVTEAAASPHPQPR